MRHRLVKIVIIFLLLPYALSIPYAYIQPPSTLMLAGWLTFHRVERDWVPLKSISPNLKAAVIASEDSAFCEHMGLDFRQMEKSIEKAQTYNKPVRGSSTITQQLAKNLFLWPGRSWIRKGLEIPLALWLELTWTKAQIFEAYLNVAEWGDGIYGARMASAAYFHIEPAALSPWQSALLATSLPNPIERNAARPGPAQVMMAGQIVARAKQPDLSCIY